MDMTPASPAQPQTPAPPPIGLETLGELLAYAGGSGALAAAGIVIGRSSDSKAVVTAILAISAVALLAVGWLAGDREDPRRRRIRGVFWFLSLTSAVELFVVVLSLDLKMSGRGDALLIGLLSSAYALFLWVMFRSCLQQIGLFLAVLGTLVVITFPDPGRLGFAPPDFSLVALVLLALGGVWIVLGQLGIVEPRRTARVLGSIVVLVGSGILSTNSGTNALILIAVAAAILIIVGELLHDVAVIGIGIAGLIFSISGVVQTSTEGSSGKSIAALIIGLAGVGIAILLLRRGAPVATSTVQPPTPEEPSPPSEAPPAPPST